MKNTNRQKFNTYSILSAIILLSGLLLLVYMIRVEGEPGALPLLLLLIGSAGLLIQYAKSQKYFTNKLKS